VDISVKQQQESIVTGPSASFLSKIKQVKWSAQDEQKGRPWKTWILD